MSSADISFRRRWSGDEEVFPTDWTFNGRRLVVIDPENDDHVELLRVAISRQPMTQNLDHRAVQLGLMSMLAPPKPAEPTGDGAVVEDHLGHRWVRIASQNGSPDSPPWRHRGHTARRYEQIAAVRVLSEGVTA
jgi:hypothetical protein